MSFHTKLTKFTNKMFISFGFTLCIQMHQKILQILLVWLLKFYYQTALKDYIPSIKYALLKCSLYFSTVVTL